jgi:hypothetical protein
MTDINKERWKTLIKFMERQFGEGLEFEGILLLIGMQELGKGYRKLNKDEKMDVMNIAVCKILELKGYYRYSGKDSDDWPHWEPVTPLPYMKKAEQDDFLKIAVIEYFESINDKP